MTRDRRAVPVSLRDESERISTSALLIINGIKERETRLWTPGSNSTSSRSSDPERGGTGIAYAEDCCRTVSSA